MNKPSVSIIVPVYNVAPYVEGCIRSVMRQTYDGPIECIVVDDCGTDDSMAIVERLIAEYNGPVTFKILHHTHNRGLSAARNTGMDAASSDYLLFLDSDDELTDDCVRVLSEPLVKNYYEVVVGNFLQVDEVGRVVQRKKRLEIPDNTVLEKDEILAAYKKKDWPIAAWNKLYLTKFVRDNHLRFYEGLIYEDVLWSAQIAILLNKLYAVNQVTYLYKKRQGSIITSTERGMDVISFPVIVIELCKFVNNQNVYNMLIHEFIQEYQNIALKCCVGSLSDFTNVYKKMRRFSKPGILKLYRANRFHLKKYIRDSHFLLPEKIAPYWHYINYYKLLPIIRIWKKKLIS